MFTIQKIESLPALRSQFLRLGAPLIQYDYKLARSGGKQVGIHTLSFNDSQTVVVTAGDVVSATLNGGAIKVDQAHVIESIAESVDANRGAFQKKLAMLRIPLPDNLESTIDDQIAALEQRRNNLLDALGLA